MSFEVDQFKTQGFELFMSSWRSRLAGAGARDLSLDQHYFWRTMRSRFAIDLSKQSELLQGVSLARYDTYLILTALLYTNSLYESSDLIVGYNLPDHFFTTNSSEARHCFSRELLDSLKLTQSLVLVDEYFENFEFNTIAYEKLNEDNPVWHDISSELGTLPSLVNTTRSEHQLSLNLLHFVPKLFSGRQLAEQINYLAEIE
ncbi:MULTISPECIES: hypothetical protein [Pseudoalteromonas]|uniref:hypothetical protein n=1 Tax=Pseudoalteromonas TaxID=53246 RepID=UPI000FFF1FD5|nr:MULTISPECIES: hypothetical protein [Pseudoalteromonas]MCG9761479.1 hypothetical protein [Pseudoalteromonas sp. Isolate6]NKC18365.1 hypothetical protein [Pseudoalteromonas galatheae]RXE85088.1 hypothetical protein DRB05_19250 [Pseudoalteromonas sp. A757]